MEPVSVASRPPARGLWADRQARRQERERHPRWIYRRLTARLRALPEFVIIGAMRSGTTSTYQMLVEHAHIERAWRKEIHFFNRDGLYARGEGWYRAHFPLRRPGIITGEATPGYMFRQDALARMARHIPAARLIALLRNPVDRAVSHYHLGVRRGWEHRPIEQAMEEQPLELSMDARETASYVARGLYALQLENVLRVFPREQLLVLSSETVFAEPAAAVTRIVAFLGLPPNTVDPLGGHTREPYPPAPAAVRRLLAEFFRPHNERLYDLLGEDFGWGRGR
jgi:hypothetical protein